jgi:hypothetical protein
MYFFLPSSLIEGDELDTKSFVQGKSDRKTETQSRKANAFTLKVMLVGPPKAGSRVAR